MNEFVEKLVDALLMAAGMFWDVGWSLVLGFLISALLQVFVSKERMQKTLGRDGAREIALAGFYGTASSSCSYASASIMRTMFKKGAALIPSLAFMLASTNLVVELGIVLYLLMGWQFILAEWLGGVVLIIIMAILVRLTYPAQLVEEARHHPEAGMMHDHASAATEAASIRVARSFAADWGMLWKDLLAGFVIAGFLAVFVPPQVWNTLFLHNQPGWLQIPGNAVVGVVIAVLSFVCSIGNVPMAAILWGSGIGFGGVLAFLYGDLIVLPLLDVYRRTLGWKMAAYIAGIFFTTMVLAALLMDVLFTKFGLVPAVDSGMRAHVAHFAFNYTFWLNLLFGAVAIYLFAVARRYPAEHPPHCCH